MNLIAARAISMRARALFGMQCSYVERGTTAGPVENLGWIAAGQALADLDSHGHCQFNALDAAFASVQLWKDLNQDGISQSAELFTLHQLGVASIKVAGTASNINLGGGNTQPFSGTFTKINNFYSSFSDDPVAIPAAAAWTQMHRRFKLNLCALNVFVQGNPSQATNCQFWRLFA